MVFFYKICRIFTKFLFHHKKMSACSITNRYSISHIPQVGHDNPIQIFVQHEILIGVHNE